MKRDRFDSYMFRIIEAGREQIQARHIIVDPKSNRLEVKMAKNIRERYALLADDILTEMVECVGRDNLEEEDYDRIEALVQEIWGFESRKVRMNRTLLETENDLIVEEVAKILDATEEDERRTMDDLFSIFE